MAEGKDVRLFVETFELGGMGGVGKGGEDVFVVDLSLGLGILSQSCGHSCWCLGRRRLIIGISGVMKIYICVSVCFRV